VPRCSQERMPTDRASTDVNEPSEPAETNPTGASLAPETPALHPRTRTCPWDPRLSHPTDEDLSAGTPALHPTDEDLSAGTPGPPPTDEDLSAGPRRGRRAEQCLRPRLRGSRFALGGLRHSRTAGNDRRARGRAALARLREASGWPYSLHLALIFGGYMDPKYVFQSADGSRPKQDQPAQDFTYLDTPFTLPPKPIIKSASYAAALNRQTDDGGDEKKRLRRRPRQHPQRRLRSSATTQPAVAA